MVRALGIDLAPVRSAACLLILDEEGAMRHRWWIWNSDRTIEARINVAKRLGILSSLTKVDVVGLEAYTNQRFSHIAFDFGEIGGLVRAEFWKRHKPTMLIAPQRRYAVLPGKHRPPDLHTEVWHHWKLPALGGDKKAREDQIDAFTYALIAAVGVLQLRHVWTQDLPRPTIYRDNGHGLLEDQKQSYFLDRLTLDTD